jgi:signal transduction histidine kinase
VKGRDILIVEDENIVALDVRMRLEAMGYRIVDVVDTGALAVQRAIDLEPDLVLMDIRLKGEQDGIDAAAQLRERSDAPVIFVTAYTDERTLDRAKRASPYGYIVKPFHERELRIAIELAIYKHQYEVSLRRARDIAEESNRLKGEFLANMSHELKTPLNSVIGFTELAMSSAKEPEQKEHLALALSSAKSLLTLIESILGFARMEAGKLNAVEAPFSLDELLDECVDSLAIVAFPKGLEVSLGRDPSIPDSLLGDSSLLQRILLNLLDNAIKFTDRGRIRLEARRSGIPGTDKSLLVEFTVSDTGIGMRPDRVDMAFARFTQLDPSTTRKAGGTGLGLAIVAKSVELMKGSLSVETEEGRGSIFIVRIPFEPGTEEFVAESPPHRGEAAVVGFEGERFTDSAWTLERLGFSARKAGSLEEAAELGLPLVVADERELFGADDRHIALLDSKLIVATRFGGQSRERLAGHGRIAFAFLPLRISVLRAAIEELPKLDGAKSLRAAKAPADRVESDSGTKPAAAWSGEMSVLARLALALERTVSVGSFAEAEREAKDAQGALDSVGDRAGSRLAFAALLAARRADTTGLSGLAVKIREADAARTVDSKGQEVS